MSETQTITEPSSEAEVRPLGFLMDVRLQVSVELGRRRFRIAELLALGQGSILELDKVAGEPLDILAREMHPIDFPADFTDGSVAMPDLGENQEQVARGEIAAAGDSRLELAFSVNEVDRAILIEYASTLPDEGMRRRMAPGRIVGCRRHGLQPRSRHIQAPLFIPQANR